MLRRARRARVPVVAIAAGPVADDVSIPYVLATDVVRVAPGEGLPLEPVAQRIAARLAEDGAPLAARIPRLRDPCARPSWPPSPARTALAAAVWSRRRPPGARAQPASARAPIAQAYGENVRERMPELAATLGAGLGLRAVARELLDSCSRRAAGPCKGGVAYTGTRGLGEAPLGSRFALAARRRPGRAAPAGR